MRFLRPANGRLVRDPITWKPLDSKGEWKSLNGYWRRRLHEGDVVEVQGGAKDKDRAKDKLKHEEAHVNG